MKKKAIAGLELIAAGGILTGGSRIMEKLTEESSPQISAQEVTYTALIKFKSLQGETSKMNTLKIVGWVVFAVFMALLAILATKAIIKILKISNKRTDHYNLDNNTSEEPKDQDKYLALTTTHPSHTRNPSMTKDLDHDQYTDSSKNIISITYNQERLNRDIRYLEQEKKSTNSK